MNRQISPDIKGNREIGFAVNKPLIVELKAGRSFSDEQAAQLPDYLRASRIEWGRSINFGAPKLQIKTFILNPEIKN